MKMNYQPVHLIKLRPVVLLLAAAFSAEVFANEEASSPPADKSRFTLFNPTPKNLLREMSTDRPDKTESPYTVDAGHFQIESDILAYTYDHDTSGGSDTRVEAWSFATLNLKVGLCNYADFQVILNPYNTMNTDDRVGDTITKQSGFGDITLRLKANLWGNDGGQTAFCVMPFVKLPSNQDHLGNHAVEGGLILPLAVGLPGGWGMGLMTEFDFNQNTEDSRYHTEFINTITFGHDIVGKLGGYLEFFSAVSTESGVDWVGTVDLGLTYGLTDDIQLDGGVNLGLTQSADDVNPFVGISARF